LVPLPLPLPSTSAMTIAVEGEPPPDGSGAATVIASTTTSTNRKRKCTYDVWEDMDKIFATENGVEVRVGARCHFYKKEHAPVLPLALAIWLGTRKMKTAPWPN
jgi:hypothetical protein